MTAPAWADEMPVTEARRRQGPRGTPGEYEPPSADQQILDRIQQHDESEAAHAYIRDTVLSALAAAGITPKIGGGWDYVPPNVGPATTEAKGLARILGGTADYPTVPWASVTTKPFIPKTFSELTGTVPPSALPAVAITDYLGAVNSQANMLLLTGQRGDWCTRTDRNSDFQLIADDATKIASWREMTYPAAPVSSVNGRTGAVTGLAEQTAVTQNANAISSLNNTVTAHTSNQNNPHGTTKTAVGLGNVDNTADLDKPLSNAEVAALANKQDVMPDIIDLESTAAATPTTAGVDVPGVTVTFNVPSASARYYISAVFDLAATAANTASSLFVGRLMVDGNPNPRAAVASYTISGQRGTVTQQWVITGLAAGSHTFKLNGYLTASASYTMAFRHCSMTIARMK